MINTILLDFDGTVCPQTNRLHYQSYKIVFENHGLELEEDDIAPLYGMPADDIMEKLVVGKSESEITQMIKEKRTILESLIRKEKLPQESIETMNKLKERGFKIAICTGSYLKPVRTIMPDYEIEVVSADSEITPKPQPDILLKAAEQIGSRPEECVYVGDTGMDLQAANAAGMKFIGVKADLTYPSLLEKNPPMLIESLPELLEIFEKSPQEVVQ